MAKFQVRRFVFIFVYRLECFDSKSNKELIKAIWESTHEGILVTICLRSKASKALQVFILFYVLFIGHYYALHTKKVSNNRNPRRSYVRVGVRTLAWIGLQNYNIYLVYANSILQFIEIGVFYTISVNLYTSREKTQGSVAEGVRAA